MSDKEKSIILKLADVFPKLDEKNQNYILGYAEGMADLRDEMNKKQLQEA